jgi:alkylhydroperoxidase/carboxymuconolactone decarboxylase family protein YurZ
MSMSAAPCFDVSRPNIVTLALSRSESPENRQITIVGDLWKRPGLSTRDRSLVTVAALIARDQTSAMPYYFNLALDKGRREALPEDRILVEWHHRPITASRSVDYSPLMFRLTAVAQ